MADIPGGTPASEEEYQRLEQEVTAAVLDRAANDPQWRRLLIEDPEAAMADLPEAQRLSTTAPPPGGEQVPGPLAEVAGQAGGGRHNCYWYRGCLRFSDRRGWKWWTRDPYDYDF